MLKSILGMSQPASPPRETEGDVGDTFEFEVEESVRVIEYEFGEFSVVEQATEKPEITEEKWRELIEKKSFKGLGYEQIIKGVLTSMPFDIRRDIWLVLAKVPRQGTDEDEQLFLEYDKLASQENPLFEKIIWDDITRTSGGREKFF